MAFQGVIGLLAVPLIAWLISEDRRALTPAAMARVIVGCLIVQFALVFLLLQMPWTRGFFEALSTAVLALQQASDAGAQLLFGFLAGAPTPYEVTQPQHTFAIAFRVLPIILVLSALVRLLYYWGVLQRVVAVFAWALQRVFGTGGPLSMTAAASLFLGLVEAPLLIRPYLATMGRGALFAAMACTMATVAGTVLALYASVLGPAVDGAAGHLVAASLINVPAALMLSRLAVPDGFLGGPAASELHFADPPKSSMDAITQGTTEGISLVAGVAAMLIVIVSLVALVNGMLVGLGDIAGAPLTLERIFGYLGAPIAFAIGIPFEETLVAGGLIGKKVILNEFLAYLDLAALDADGLSERSRLIVTYALCGFANLGSLGILIGGLSQMVPERRSEIVALAPRAMLVGFLATMLSASVVGMIV